MFEFVFLTDSRLRNTSKSMVVRRRGPQIFNKANILSNNKKINLLRFVHYLFDIVGTREVAFEVVVLMCLNRTRIFSSCLRYETNTTAKSTRTFVRFDRYYVVSSPVSDLVFQKKKIPDDLASYKNVVFKSLKTIYATLWLLIFGFHFCCRNIKKPEIAKRPEIKTSDSYANLVVFGPDTHR